MRLAAVLAAALALAACADASPEPPAPGPTAAPVAAPGPSAAPSPPPAGVPVSRPEVRSGTSDPRALFRAYCGACHSLDIAVAQRLDRASWDWVLDDMITKYGATWITPEEREVLLDYLVKNHGPKKRR